MKQAIIIGMILIPWTGAADQILLKGGGSISGVMVERSSLAIVMEVGPGRLTLPMARVTQIIPGESPLTIYRQRVLSLTRGTVAEWLDLAHWAQARDLETQAREAFEHVRKLDPENATAQQALGRVLLGQRWVSPEESMMTRGYVLFEGNWILPDNRDAILRERSMQAEAARQIAIAESARAEAEARAKEAEARARLIESQATSLRQAWPANALSPFTTFSDPIVMIPTAARPCCGSVHQRSLCPRSKTDEIPITNPNRAPEKRKTREVSSPPSQISHVGLGN